MLKGATWRYLAALILTCAVPALAYDDPMDPNVTHGTVMVDGVELGFYKQAGLTLLGNSCDYDWWYGCSPTSAGMMMGYYDRNGYGANPLTNQYPALVPGGLAETETYAPSPPPTGWAALANNAIASTGHVADFYVAGYGASGDDVAPPHHSPNCLADFMGTSQDSQNNSNGSTTFYYYTDGNPLHAANAFTHGIQDQDGMYGMCEYLDYCGYGSGNPTTDTNFFTQLISGTVTGFTFANYKTEIDASRPVLIHIEGHTMCGYGYDDTGGAQTVYIYDTWSLGVPAHTMTWGGAYSGSTHWGVTCMTPTNGVPEPASLALLVLGGMILLRRRMR